MSDSTKSEKLSIWRKIGYGLGDIYGGGSGIIVSFYYLYFLTDIIRISPALAGVVILISKIYDAVTDPFEGLIADRTRTKMGRRRPYLLAGIPLVFLSFFALFYPANFDEEITRFVFVICTYLFFSTIVSIVMLNYNALQSELTLDYDERTSLSSSRIFFSTVSSILCALLPLEIVKMFPDVRQGYIIMGLVFGAFFALPFIATVFATRERKEFQKPPGKFDIKIAFLEPFKIRTFVLVLFMYLLAFVAMDTVSSVIIYFMKYYLGRGDEANYVSGALLIAQVVALPFYVWLSKKTSKKTAYITAAVFWLVIMLMSFLIVPGQSFYFIYVFAVLVGIGTGGIVITVYSMFPDIPDIDEFRSGERREGIFTAMIGFMRKFSSAIAIFMVSQVIGLAGYIEPIEKLVNGNTQLIEQAQSDTFILALRLIFVLVPGVFLAVALLLARKFPLTAELHQRLNIILTQRRANIEDKPEQKEEIAWLEETLIGGKK